MAKKQNTFAKRQKEIAKKRKAEEKRERRWAKKDRKANLEAGIEVAFDSSEEEAAETTRTEEEISEVVQTD